jgi:hypothetical protein
MLRVNMVGDDGLVLGTDHQYVLHVLDHTSQAIAIDITGWTITFVVKRSTDDPDSKALLSKAANVAGTFNATASANTQRGTVTINRADTSFLSSGKCVYEWRRTDTGFNTPLRRGDLELVR